MIGVQRELKAEGKDYRAFEVLNLGKYERQHFIGVNPNLRDAEKEKQLEEKEAAFVDLILRAYRAERVDGFRTFQGKKAGRLVAVGPVNLPVTRLFVEEIILECREKHITTRRHPGLRVRDGPLPERARRGARQRGSTSRPSTSRPRSSTSAPSSATRSSSMTSRPSRSRHASKGTSVAVELTDFSVFYSQDSIANAEATLKNKAQQDRGRSRARS